MSLWPSSPRPERFNRAGELILSSNHLALLQGLFDRPGGRAQSRDDWLRAALPLLRGKHAGASSYWTMAKSIRTIPPSLVDRRRVGNQVHFSLTQRGRDVLSGTVAAYVTSVGPFRRSVTRRADEGAA
jgi:hypothetical protein